jgi:hypothetical protein
MAPTTDQIVASTFDENPMLRCEAADAIAVRFSPEPQLPLHPRWMECLKWLIQDPVACVRRQALRAVCRLHTGYAKSLASFGFMQQTEACLRDRCYYVRMAAAETMCGFLAEDPKRLFSLLCPMSRDAEADVRHRFFVLMTGMSSSLCDTKTLDDTFYTAQMDLSAFTGGLHAYTLRGLDIFFGGLFDDYSEVRIAAAEAITAVAAVDPPACCARLARLLTDEIPQVRSTACQALGRIHACTGCVPAASVLLNVLCLRRLALADSDRASVQRMFCQNVVSSRSDFITLFDRFLGYVLDRATGSNDDNALLREIVVFAAANAQFVPFSVRRMLQMLEATEAGVRRVWLQRVMACVVQGAASRNPVVWSLLPRNLAETISSIG